MNKRRLVWVAVAAVVLAGGGTGVALTLQKNAQARAEANRKKVPPPLEFLPADVVQLVPRRLAIELSLPGSVAAVSQATVRSKLSAEVRRVTVREGERVAAGQVVVEFDTAQLRTQLAERAAALESARAQLAQTERTRQANAQLVKQNFISQNAFDTADAAFRAQAAAVEAARAQVAQTELLLGDAVVRAPIAGHVARRHVQPGEKVAFDAPLLSIVDLSQLEVQAQIPVSDVALVKPGATVDVDIEGLSDRVFKGRIDRINPSTEPGTRMINVYATIANENDLLRAGMFARVRIAVGPDREVPALPITAVQAEGGQSLVWVIADGKLSRRTVTLGRRDERAQLVEILSGVTNGERVIRTRFDNLKDGLAARVVTGDAPIDQKMATGRTTRSTQ